MLQDADAWVKLGHEKLDTENYGAALIFFNQALTTDPENSEAWTGRAMSLQKLGSIQEILSVSNHSIAKVLYERGRKLEQKGDYVQAINSYNQALRIKPEFEEVKQSLSNALKNLQSADFLSFVTLRPSSPSTLTNDSDYQPFYDQAEDLRSLGRYQEAIPYLNKAIQQQPQNYLAYNGRGNTLRKLGRYEEAILDLNEAIKLQPEYHLAYYHRGDIQRKLGRYEESISDYNQAITLQPKYHLAYNGRGNTYRDWGHYEKAIDDFNKAIDLQPNDHIAYNNRGAAKRKLRYYKEAINDFNKAIEISDKQNWRAWVNLGWTYFQDRNYYSRLYQTAWQTWNKGLNELESWKKLHPQNPEYQRGVGELHWCKGKAQYRYELNHFKPYEFWDKADKSYELALKTLTFEQFPVRHLEVLQDLIQVCQYLKWPREVQVLLDDATNLLRRLLTETQSERAKILLSKKFASFNQIGVDIFVQLGKIKEALESAEERKNLCLTWLREGWRDSPESSLNFDQMQELLSPHTALVYWHISPSALTTFILRYEEDPVAWTLKPEPQSWKLSHISDDQQQVKINRIDHLRATAKLNEFEKWMARWRWKYEKNHQDTKNIKEEAGKDWYEQMEEELEELNEILNIKEIKEHLSSVDQLILIPHRDLHLLPLHALFIDKFTITYLPSIQVGIDLQQLGTAIYSHLPIFSIEHFETAKSKNKDNSLLYAEMESVAITAISQMYISKDRNNNRKFPFERKLFTDADCTLANIIQVLKEKTDFLHFTGHAYHNINSPTDSALLLANGEQLTLLDIFNNKLDFRRYYLICLSACETGKTGKQGLIDEFVGLAAGFLAAGAPCVVSTLWRVDEISAALVMIRFYQLLWEYPPSTALKKAQLWLCDATYETLAQWCKDVAKLVADHSLTQSENWEDAADSFQEQADRMDSNNRPYHNPYHWAAFTITGRNVVTIQQC